MRGAAVGAGVLGAVALWTVPAGMLAPALLTLGSLIVVLGMRGRSPLLAYSLAGGAAAGSVPVLGVLIPVLAVALFAAVAAAVHVSSSRSIPHLAAIPVRSRE